MKRHPGTYKDWKLMGDEIKAIRNRLIQFLVNRDYQALLTLREKQNISNAIDRIDRFRYLSEERMFRVERRSDEKKWIRVFYGE